MRKASGLLPVYVFGLPLLIFGTMALLVSSPYFKSRPDLISLGVTVDLLLTAPLLYFVLIRKTRIPGTTVVPVLFAGVVLGSFILPAENQMYLDLFKTWALPVIEFSVLGFVVYKLRKAIRHFKAKKENSFDFFTTLKATCSEILPRAAVMLVATEIAVFYYGFLSWGRRQLRQYEFSYHKNSGTVSLLFALIIIVGVETFVLHSLLMKWSSTAAWIVSLLSIYTGLQLFGFLKSLFQRPISIESGKLYLRYGIMAESVIELSNIASIEMHTGEIGADKNIRKLSPLGSLESHNMIIHLKESNTLSGLYGREREYKSIAFFIDSPGSFKSVLEAAF